MTISGARRAEFIESFARAWTSRGASRTEGRIAAYLLLDESDGVTAAQIAADLDVSTGTRHFMARDVWGRFLQHERPYLQAQRDLAARALPDVPEGSPAHERLTHMHHYMAWLLDDVRLDERWQEVKAGRADPAAGSSAE